MLLQEQAEALRIAIFDYQVKRTNPAGVCHLRMIRALAHEHEFTVFSAVFENPYPERVKWVRVPVPRRPLALLFVAYHFIAPIVYWLYRLKTGVRFDLVQMVESDLSFGAIAYSHFCHTSFLKNHWSQTQSSGVRGFLRWLDHRLHALMERRVYSSAKQILTPSRGLARELQTEFPKISGRVEVLPNAVDVDRLPKPATFDRDGFRASLGIDSLDVVFVFIALGHFERKGLPIVLQALSQAKLNSVKLLVVGGTEGLIDSYRARVNDLGLTGSVIFAGMQPDVHPYFWAADAFVLASNYETFSLVAFEAAAASLPLITPRLHGIEEIVEDGRTGYIVSRTVEDVSRAIEQFTKLTPGERTEMGRRARMAAMQYNEERFVENWRRFYNKWVVDGTMTSMGNREHNMLVLVNDARIARTSKNALMPSILNNRRALIVTAFAFAIFSLFCVADCMRETDQASVLIGAWRLFRRSPIVGEAYYNYDKLYGTYWITALGFWIRSHVGEGWSPVLVGNVTSAIVFWSTTLAAVLVIAKRLRKVDVLPVVLYLSTPAILINSVYMNPAIMSAGFLLLSGTLLFTSRTRLRRALAAFFFFVAVGARGDAVLLAPLLVWLQVPKQNWFRKLFTSSTTWLLAGAIAASTLLGLTLYTGKPLYFDPGYLGAKVFLGYVVFGLGASLLAFLLLLTALVSCVVMATSVRTSMFYLLGAGTLALPVVYYAFQLWSPRYLVTTALGVFLFSVSRRGRALLKLRSLKAIVSPLRLSLGTAAVLALVIGLKLPSPTRPSFTFSQPTLFPSADGLHPMGSYGEFLLRVRHSAEQEIDHDQVVWKAARQADYMPDPDGFVHILYTPMQAYLSLGATLKGLQPKLEYIQPKYHVRRLYADSRTFMRIASAPTDGTLARLLDQPARVVSPVFQGVTVLEFTEGGDPSWGFRTKLLTHYFKGNEYRVYTPSDLKRYSAPDKRPFVILADRPFTIVINGRPATADLDHKYGTFYLQGYAERFSGYRVLLARADQLTFAIQVLPDWMSVHNR